MSDERTETSAAFELAATSQTPHVLVPGKLATVVLPGGYSVEEIDLEQYAEQPARTTGHVTFKTHTSLSRYVNEHKTAATTLWADVDGRRIVAVLNDHEGGDGGRAGWGDHRATLQLRHTPEWEFWRLNDDKWLPQVKFAEHIQDGIPDIVAPPAADMVELSMTFSAKRNVDFGSAHRLQDGQTQLTYKEKVEATAGAGNIEIPEKFTLRIAPFVGFDPIEIEAWLRYRINDGALSLSYKLDQVERALRAVFDDISDAIASATGIDPYQGSPRN